ncbi:MAG TPA: DUF58 domain-containing protein [Gaiellaceae bacterium]|jgi:uncharacterized protein (DUF58 family)
MTRRGRFVLGLGLLTYVASWVFGSRPLVPVAVGLVLAPLAAWAWVRATTRPVRLDRVSRREHALEGEDVEIELRAELAAAPPALAIEERIGGLGERRTGLERHGRRAAARYVLGALPRGRYPVEESAAVVEDPFGFARSETPLEPGPALLVYPRLVEIDALFSEAGRLNRGGRPLLLRRPTGYDLHSVREYVEGDSLRAVHWPSTAHRGQLMVKELEEAPRDEVAVLLDCAGAGEPFEVAVRCAGSIVAAQDRRGRPSALVVNVGARRVERDFTEALELLAGVEVDPAAPIEELLAHEAARALEVTVVTGRLPRALVDALVGRRGAALVYVDSAGRREPELLRLASSGVAVATVRLGDDLAEKLRGAVARAS